MPSHAVEDVVEVARGLGRCTTALNSAERLHVARVAELAKETLRCGVRSFVANAAGEPCSRNTSSAGAPIAVSRRLAAELPQGGVYRRSGEACCEFQVGRSFYRSSNSATWASMPSALAKA